MLNFTPLKLMAARWRELALAAGSLSLFACTAAPPAGTTYRYSTAGEAGSQDSTTALRSAPIESRPGLGTEWGEHRYSGVTPSDFVRASSSPSGRTTIYYNDREGIDAMMAGHRWPSRKRSFDVGGVASVEIRGGGWSRALPGYYIHGRNYVVGSEGSRYTIKVRNRSSRRIEVVLSVDGLDVIDGRSASSSKRGYVIAPRGSVTVEGWRKNRSSVAAFRFGAVSDSYAARSGAGTRNVGVIGAAVFTEKTYHYHHGHHHHHHDGSESGRRHAADPFPGESRFAKPPRY